MHHINSEKYLRPYYYYYLLTTDIIIQYVNIYNTAFACLNIKFYRILVYTVHIRIIYSVYVN